MTNLSTLAGFSSGGGGGGGSSSSSGGIPTLATAVDSITVRCGSSGHNRSTLSYTSGHIAGAAPSGLIKNRDTFAHWAQWTDSGTSGFTVSSYKINKTTGALSQLQGGHQDVWVNNSGGARSTTYCIYDPVHGCFFSGGHNSYASNSSHVFGYSAGQINTAGALVGGTSSHSNSDHHANGTYCGCLPQGQGTQYFRSGGYNASSRAGGRIITCSSSGISVGSWSDDGNWTSSSGRYSHIYQPDIQTTPSGQVTCIAGTSFNTGDYGYHTLRGSSASAVHNIEAGYQSGTVWAGYNGATYQQMANTLYGSPGNSSGNTFVSYKDGTQDLGSHTMPSSYVQDIVGIGNNRFLHFNMDGDLKGTHCDLITFNSSHNPQHIQRFSFGSSTAPSVLDPATGVTTYFVVFENNSDTYPKWLISATSSDAGTELVTSYEITADLSTYDP
jgi:hypothetical protein